MELDAAHLPLSKGTLVRAIPRCPFSTPTRQTDNLYRRSFVQLSSTGFASLRAVAHLPYRDPSHPHPQHSRRAPTRLFFHSVVSSGPEAADLLCVVGSLAVPLDGLIVSLLVAASASLLSCRWLFDFDSSCALLTCLTPHLPVCRNPIKTMIHRSLSIPFRMSPHA